MTLTPLPGVKLTWEPLTLTTDGEGKFKVAAVTRRELTFPGREAPPIHFIFNLQKAGYCERWVKYSDTYGGGSSAEYVWKVQLPMTSVARGPCEAAPNGSR